MQQYPAPDKINNGATEKQHQLRNKYNCDIMQIFCIDTGVYNALRKKGKYQLN